jgi:hypothetical protein
MVNIAVLGMAGGVAAAVIHWPLPSAAAIAGFAVMLSLIWFGQTSRGNPFANWPLRLLPIHLAALLAPINAGLTLVPLAFFLIRRWPRPGMVDVMAIVFTAWATFCDSEHWAGPTSSLFYWMLCLLFIATRHSVSSVREFVSVCVVYIAGCFYVAITVILQAPFSTGAEWRPTTGANINYTAYVLLTGIVLIFAITAVVPVTNRIRSAQACIATILATGIWFTGTRAALLGLGAGIAFTLTRKLAASRVGWVLIAGGLVPATLLAVGLGLYGDAQLTELERLFNRQTGDLSGRLDVWPYARAVWDSEQLTGVGMNHFLLMNPMGIGAHNVVLTLGVDFGWIGLLLYASMVTAVFVGFGSHTRCRRLGGMLLLSWLLIWATGHWEAASAAWLVLGLWSRLPAIVERSSANSTAMPDVPLPQAVVVAGVSK